MPGIVDDLLQMQQGLAMTRFSWEAAWRDVVALAMPMAAPIFDQAWYGTTAGSLTGLASGPNSVRRSREIFDDTAVWAQARLSAGMASLTIPKNQRWHNLRLTDPFGPDAEDEEQEWLDRLRDYLFLARYNPRSNFDLASQKAIKGACGLGTGIIMTEENTGQRMGIDVKAVPVFYREIPVYQVYLSIDAWDDVDRVIRVVTMTARQAARYFTPEKCSPKVREYAEDSKKSNHEFAFMHVVMPRGEAEDYSMKRSNQPWASFWVDIDNRHMINASGFVSMPYHVMWWDQTSGSPYGESPIMQCMSEIKLLQHIKKSTLQAAQQLVKPPMALAEGIYNSRLNLNSGAVNPNLIDGNGRLKAQPLVTVSNPSFAERLIEAQRQVIKDGTYVSLFQSLTENPRMTATEALIRNSEKGDLLGGAGSKIEAGFAQVVDREIVLIGNKGAFEDGSPLAAPESMAGADIGAVFDGPLSKMRRTQDLQGVQAVLQMAQVIAQYDQSVAQKIDADATLEIVQDVSGAPRRMFRTDAEIAEMREQQAQGQEQQASAQVMAEMAKAAKDGGAAMQSIAAAGEMAA